MMTDTDSSENNESSIESIIPEVSLIFFYKKISSATTELDSNSLIIFFIEIVKLSLDTDV